MHAGRAGVLNHTHTCGRLRLRSHIGSNRIRTHSKPTFSLQQPADPIPSTCLRRQNGRAECQEIGPVILASGVFVADLTSDSLLAQFPAAVFHAPPTNGEPCAANGIKMGEASGAKRVNLEWVHDLPSALCGRLLAVTIFSAPWRPEACELAPPFLMLTFLNNLHALSIQT